MNELLERIEARQAGKAKAEMGKSMPKRGTVYSETDVSVTVKIGLKELGKLLREKSITIKARDANREPNTYTVTIEYGGKGVAS